jgi:hypothetical protein
MKDNSVPLCPLSVLQFQSPPKAGSPVRSVTAPTANEIAQIRRALAVAAAPKASVIPTGGANPELAALEAEEAELDRQLAKIPAPPAGLVKVTALRDRRRDELAQYPQALETALKSQRMRVECAKQLAHQVLADCIRRTSEVSVARGYGEVSVPDLDAMIARGFADPEQIKDVETFLTTLPVFKHKGKRPAK